MLTRTAASIASPAGAAPDQRGGDPSAALPAPVRRGSTIPPAVAACAVVVVAVCGTGLAIALLRPIQVLPFLRPAPPITLHDAGGAVVAPAATAGSIVLFQVSALRCPGRCDDGHAALQVVQRRLAAAPPSVPVSLVTIVLDGDGHSGALRRRAAALGADSRWWRLGTADAAALKNSVGAGFGVYYTADQNRRPAFEPATVLVDERGIVRAEYRTARPDPARMLRDLDLVLREASSRGAARAAYAAAHLFLCYPR
jgi:cytochrome oxidase Cu insertion factor (SCO1/SenC/PrrC family)